MAEAQDDDSTVRYVEGKSCLHPEDAPMTSKSLQWMWVAIAMAALFCIVVLFIKIRWLEQQLDTLGAVAAPGYGGLLISPPGQVGAPTAVLGVVHERATLVLDAGEDRVARLDARGCCDGVTLVMESGSARVTLGIDADGSPFLVGVDRQGKETFALGRE